jgi:hypothetical protein
MNITWHPEIRPDLGPRVIAVKSRNMIGSAELPKGYSKNDVQVALQNFFSALPSRVSSAVIEFSLFTNGQPTTQPHRVIVSFLKDQWRLEYLT